MDFFFFFLRLTYGIWKFLGQGLNPNHSCDLCCHCDNASSLTHCTTVGAPTMGIFEKHCLRKISIIPYTTAISHFKIFFYLSMTNKAWAWDPLYSWYSVHSLAPHPFQFQSLTFYFIFLNLFIFCFLGPHSRHMEVPKLGVESEPQLLAYATAIATTTQDQSHICDL